MWTNTILLLFVSAVSPAPEKWDLITRGWKGTPDVANGSNASNGKAFVQRVRLLIMDEVCCDCQILFKGVLLLSSKRRITHYTFVFCDSSAVLFQLAILIHRFIL